MAPDPPATTALSPHHLSIPIPQTYGVIQALAAQVAVSRDGSLVVFSAAVAGGGPGASLAREPFAQLFVKALDQPAATPLAGTERAHAPFLSPDGTWVGFLRDGTIYKMPVRGGAAVRLASAGGFSGASWADDGHIVFSPTHGGTIWRVSERGGEPEQLTRLDAAKGERGHHQPNALPGGRAFLFTIEVAGRSHDDARIAVQSIGSTEKRILIEGGMSARYVPTGHLLFARRGQLYAVRFDLARLQIAGEPVPVLGGVRTNPSGGSADFAVAEDGSLVYVPGVSVEPHVRLLWVERDGVSTALNLPADDYRNPRLSPSGDRIVVEVGGADDNVWVVDLARSVRRRMSFGFENLTPLWFPSGDRVAVIVDDGSAPGLYEMGVAGQPRNRLLDGNVFSPGSFSRDGSVLTYVHDAPGTGLDIWTFDLASRERKPLIETQFDEEAGMISPDGKWIAYVSTETGQREIFLARYPDLSGKVAVSVDGGAEPVWARSGRELFFRQADTMMSVAIDGAGAAVRVGRPRALFHGRYATGIFGLPGYDVSVDGARFLMVGLDPAIAPATQVNYVLGWSNALK